MRYTAEELLYPNGMARWLHVLLVSVTLSRAETETIVKKDLAERLKVSIDQLQMVSSVDRTWPDANLGCGARKGLVEPARTPGFAITLAYEGKQYVYHSDRSGRFRRCDAGKPIAPISR